MYPTYILNYKVDNKRERIVIITCMIAEIDIIDIYRSIIIIEVAYISKEIHSTYSSRCPD